MFSKEIDCTNKRILLIYPATDVNLTYPGAEFDEDGYKSIPVGNLALASFMSSDGYSVKFIDGRIYPKKQILEIIEQEMLSFDLAAISTMTCQVKHGLILSKFIREKRPDLPIVWGGIHPTLFPEQTVSDPLVDYVIAGEGEHALRDLMKFIINKNISLSEVRGLAYKTNNNIKFNGVAPLIDVNALPTPDYSLLDIDKYINRHLVHNFRVRGLDILSSRGCPYRCAFCTNTFLLKQKWRPLPLKTVLEIVDKLISLYNLNNIWFVDDFFFGEKERPRKIANYFLSKNYKITWEADIRADNFRNDFINDEYLSLLKQSGLYSLRMGAESGSNETLKLIKKDITTEQTYNAVRQCAKHKIVPVLFFMIGIPGETKKAARQTISFIMRLKNKFPRTWVYGPGIFRIYPGSELYQQCLNSDTPEPKTLREWGGDLLGGYVGSAKLPWLRGRQKYIEDLVFFNNMFLALKGQHPYPGLRIFFGILAGLRENFNFWHLRCDAAGVRLYKFLCDRLNVCRSSSSKKPTLKIVSKIIESVYCCKRKIFPPDAGPFPKQIDIEITNACNLDCIICPRSSMTRPISHMKFELFEEIIDQISEYGLEHMTLALFGEPLLNPDIFRMAKLAKEKGRVGHLYTSTNAIMLNKTMCEEFIRCGLDKIIIAIDGATKETYEQIRKGGSYEKVLQNTLELLRVRRQMKIEKPIFVIQIVSMKETINEVNDFYNFWKPYLNNDDIIQVKPYLTWAGKVADRAFDKKNGKIEIRTPCLTYLWRNLAIYNNGDVTTCCYDFNGEMILGNLKEIAIEEIWHSKKLEEIRKAHLNRKFSNFKLCDNCQFTRRQLTAREILNFSAKHILSLK